MKLRKTKSIALMSVLALAGCTANSFTETMAPTLIPPADLAKYRCEQLGLPGDKDCLLKQYEQIVEARAKERTAAAGAPRTTTNTTVTVNTPK